MGRILNSRIWWYFGGKVIVFDVAYTGNGSYTEVRESMEDNMIIVSSARTW